MSDASIRQRRLIVVLGDQLSPRIAALRVASVDHDIEAPVPLPPQSDRPATSPAKAVERHNPAEASSSSHKENAEFSVTVRFRLNRDGTVNGTPTVVEFPASELGKAAAVDAIRAVRECGPFELPGDKYDQWTEVQLRFEP